MKILAVLTSALLAAPAFADVNSTIVRCTGLNAKGIQIGADFEHDPADRILNLTTFVAEATNPVSYDSLGAPSHFLRVDAKNKLQLFGFKSFNDGLDEVMSVTYVIGNPKLSVLKLGDGTENLAVKKITCGVIN